MATSFSGNLEGDRRFHFTLTVGPSARVGTINTPLGVYEIDTVGGVTWLYPRDALPDRSMPHKSDAVVVQPRFVRKQPPEIEPPTTLETTTQ